MQSGKRQEHRGQLIYTSLFLLKLRELRPREANGSLRVISVIYEIILFLVMTVKSGRRLRTQVPCFCVFTKLHLRTFKLGCLGKKTPQCHLDDWLSHTSQALATPQTHTTVHILCSNFCRISRLGRRTLSTSVPCWALLPSLWVVSAFPPEFQVTQTSVTAP